MELIVIVVLLALVEGLAVMAFGESHDRLARVFARLRGIDLDTINDENAARTLAHPYAWRAFTLVGAAVVPVAMLLVVIADNEMRCTMHAGAPPMVCEASRIYYGIGGLERRTDKLPGFMKIEEDGKVLRLIDQTGSVVTVDESERFGRVAHQYIVEAFAGRRDFYGLVVNSNVSTRPLARFPWVVMLLLLPNLAASVAWSFKGPVRDPETSPAAPFAPEPAAPVVAVTAPAVVLDRCPRCQVALARDRGLLQEHVCHTCHGRLLPREAAHRVLVEELGLSLDVLREVASHFAGKRLGCPACGTRMSPVQLKGTASDLCLGCGALWLDAGELKRLSEGRWDEVG